MLRLLSDTREQEWLLAAIPDRDALPGPPVVAHCLPNIYARYVKVLHPFWLEEGATLESVLASQNEPDVPEAGHPPIPPPGSYVRSRPVPYAPFLKALGVPVFPELNPQTVWRGFNAVIRAQGFRRNRPEGLLTPETGSLDRPTCAALVDALKPYAAEPCLFRYWWLDFLDWDTETDKVFEGSLRDVLSVFEWEHVKDTPTHWWSRDRAWCVYSSTELQFTLVGGTSEVVEALLRHPDLETVEVRLDTRVDDEAGVLNRD